MTKTVMIVLAGGSGKRFQSEKPKQLAMLAGKTVLEHTIANVAACPSLDEVIVVARATIRDEVREMIARLDLTNVSIAQGGTNRLESTRAGLMAVDGPPETKVLVHDGVRPFLKHSTIADCLRGLDLFEAVDVVIPLVDTLVRASKGGETIRSIPKRTEYRRGQTPQGFRLGALKDVVESIPNLAEAEFTDDCGMYLKARPDADIALIAGDEANIKITHPIDLFLAEQLIISGKAAGVLDAIQLDLTGLDIVIFGSTSGLGEDARNYLAERGVNIHDASRRTGCDISKPEDVADFLETTAKKAGKIDAVLNFAGVLHIGKLASATQEDLDSVVQINYMGTLNVARFSHKYLAQTGGQLILVSSSSYYRGRSDYSVYSSSKAAVVNLTQALAEEWNDDRIRVNCIVPRRADTPMRRAAFPGEAPETLLKPRRVTEEVVKLLQSTASGMINHVY